MSPICILLSVLTVGFAIGCVAFRRKNKSFNGMLCKFMASFGFISVAIVGYGANPNHTFYFCLVCFALLFGFCGDVMLGIKEIAPQFKSKLVVLGTLYFLIGHIFYLCAFIRMSGFSIAALLCGIAGILISTCEIKLFKMKLKGKMAVFMILYYSTLIYKTASAIVAASRTGKTAFIVAAIGAVLFLISDSCLAILYFTPVKKKNVFVTIELSTYYPAQILLAMSVALLGLPS